MPLPLSLTMKESNQMKILTTAQMRELDRAGIEQGLPLMENAGAAVARFVAEEFPEAQRIQVVCGKGNNGGDGRVAAQKLREAGKDVEVFDAASDFQLAAGLVIDAVLGSGFHPPVQDPYAAAIQKINQSNCKVVAVDVPSGTDADQAHQPEGAARADAVITFTAPKIAHVFANLTRGPIAVAGIGIPSETLAGIPCEMEVITPADFVEVLQPRDPDSNKGSYGHVLVIGGARGKAGAPAMAAMAALRAGAGLVTVAVPQSVQATVSGFAPELMTEGLAETDAGSIALNALDYGRLESLLEGKNVIAIGPGVGRHPETAEFVRTLLHRLNDSRFQKSNLRIVLDADGLNAFESQSALLQAGNLPMVLTPHPGEMSRLTGLTVQQVQDDRVNIARSFSGDHNCTVVLKGHKTIICFPKTRTGNAAAPRVWVNTTGNPGMATGGTGDVLTGITAGLLAQSKTRNSASTGDSAALTAAINAAVYLHGLAGDLAASQWGEASLVATDLLTTLPEAFTRARQSIGSNTIYLQNGHGKESEI